MVNVENVSIHLNIQPNPETDLSMARTASNKPKQQKLISQFICLRLYVSVQYSR